MKKVATIILNRNLPQVTNKLRSVIKKTDNEITDIHILESGSDKDKLSKYYTWHAEWDSAVKKGLRVPRGFNYALSMLNKENKFEKYDYFFLLTNDTVFEKKQILKPLLKIMKEHKRLGVLSPCSKNWGEFNLLKKNRLKYVWYLQNTAYLIRKDFIKSITNVSKGNINNFLYDGKNFRGYCLELEIIAKGYINNWATAITNATICSENEEYLKNNFRNIKTDPYDKNLHLYIKEGEDWMFNKYGFKSKWNFLFYIKNYYDDFFLKNKELINFKI